LSGLYKGDISKIYLPASFITVFKPNIYIEFLYGAYLFVTG